MSYASSTDFLALLRQTGNGVRFERMPGLDWAIEALARAGMFLLWVHPTDAPIADQASTLWFRPVVPTWQAEGSVYLWNADASEFQPATLPLWQKLFGSVQRLDRLLDVAVTEGPGIDGQFLKWDDGAGFWVAQTIPAGITRLDALDDVNVVEGAPIDGEFLKWDEGTGKWVAGTPPAGIQYFHDLLDVGIGIANGGYVLLSNGDQVLYDSSEGKWVNRGMITRNVGNWTGGIAMNSDTYPFTTFTPTGAVQLQNQNPIKTKSGTIAVVEILTSGATSFNVTFTGTDGWTTQGTLATGTVSGKRFTLTFMSDDVGHLHEMSRIGPF
jgi:hypothetical protein